MFNRIAAIFSTLQTHRMCSKNKTLNGNGKDLSVVLNTKCQQTFFYVFILKIGLIFSIKVLEILLNMQIQLNVS